MSSSLHCVVLVVGVSFGIRTRCIVDVIIIWFSTHNNSRISLIRCGITLLSRLDLVLILLLCFLLFFLIGFVPILERL